MRAVLRFYAFLAAASTVGQLAYGQTITSCTTPGTVALTFDDGPSEYTVDLLNLLDRYNAKATFFVVGDTNKGTIDDEKAPWAGIVRSARDKGHQIGAHAWSHPDLCTLSTAQRTDEMTRLQTALGKVLGVVPTYMRPPYMSCSNECGCLSDIVALGYRVIGYDLDTSDYLHTEPGQQTQSIATFDAGFAGRNPTTGSALVISHDVHYNTVHHLAEHMLKAVQAAGFRAVTVGECLGDSAANWYRSA